MSRWTGRAQVFTLPQDGPGWMATHASVPLPWLTGDGLLRIYFAARDAENRSRVGWLEAEPDDPSEILAVGDMPCLDLGETGAFDDSGVMPGSLVPADDGLWLYYTGWNVGVSVPFRTAIGVAVSRDGGRTFERAHAGPVLDRSLTDPHFVTTPFVVRDAAGWT